VPSQIGSSHDLEREKTELERAKVAIEREKLLLEKYKTRWHAVYVGIPLLVAAATVGLGVWSQYKQGRQAFELKAAEIVLATDSPWMTRHKSDALKTLFPDLLRKDFATSFNPDAFPPSDTRPEILNLILSKPESASEVLRIWNAAYPEEAWAVELRKKLTPGLKD
jgi:hypothetical protein